MVGSVRFRRRNERGAALVEFALTLPIFVALVLGLFSGGLAYNQKLSLQHAAREGARYGSTLDQAGFGTGADWGADIESVVRERAGGDLPAAPEGEICVALVDPSGSRVGTFGNTNSTTTGCYSETSPGTSGNRVQVSIKRPAKLEVFFFSRNLSLTSHATARFER